MSLRSGAARRRRQCGAAVLVLVAGLLLLGLLAALGAGAALVRHAAGTGAQADYQRALFAAEALLHDAETDIRGGAADGTPCRTGETIGCRDASGGVFFPRDPADYLELLRSVGSDPVLPCRQGICLPADTDQLDDPATSRRLMRGPPGRPRAYARLGEFTGLRGGPEPAAGDDKGMYWVEVFEHPPLAGLGMSGFRYLPDPARPFVFRITAVAEGRRPGTRVALREIFIPSALAENP